MPVADIVTVLSPCVPLALGLATYGVASLLRELPITVDVEQLESLTKILRLGWHGVPGEPGKSTGARVSHKLLSGLHTVSNSAPTLRDVKKFWSGQAQTE